MKIQIAMSRKQQLSRQDQANLASVLPHGSFSWDAAVESLRPYGITNDQVRTVIKNAPDVKRIKRGLYYRGNKNETAKWLPKSIIKEEPMAELNKEIRAEVFEALGIQDAEPDRIKYLDTIPASVLVGNLRKRGHEVKCTRIEEL